MMKRCNRYAPVHPFTNRRHPLILLSYATHGVFTLDVG